MPVEQPVLDTNYKHLKIIRTWPKTTMIKTSVTIAIIVAYRGENNINCLREKANKQKTKQGGGGRRRWGNQSTKRQQRELITELNDIRNNLFLIYPHSYSSLTACKTQTADSALLSLFEVKGISTDENVDNEQALIYASCQMCVVLLGNGNMWKR